MFKYIKNSSLILKLILFLLITITIIFIILIISLNIIYYFNNNNNNDIYKKKINLSPVLECITINLNTSTKSCIWGYNNNDNKTYLINVSNNNNRFIPSPKYRGQPLIFNSGRYKDVFITHNISINTNLIWRLNKKTSTCGNKDTCKRCFNIPYWDYLNVCSGNGICISKDNCKCNYGYYGNNCQFKNSTSIWQCYGINYTNPLVCNSNGICISQDNCICNYGYITYNCKYNCIPYYIFNNYLCI